MLYPSLKNPRASPNDRLVDQFLACSLSPPQRGLQRSDPCGDPRVDAAEDLLCHDFVTGQSCPPDFRFLVQMAWVLSPKQVGVLSVIRDGQEF